MTEALRQQEAAPVSSGEDDVRQYLREIRRFPLLTAQQERELARGCARGDEESIRQLVNSNLRLVVAVAREYAGRGVSLLDLIQEGSIGLLSAARRFDYTLDYRFSTYATKWIRQGVTRCLMNHASLIRIPVHTAERIRKVEQARARLRQELGEEPSLERLGEECGLTPQRTEELLRLAPQVVSLDLPTGDEDDGTLGALLEDSRAPLPQQELVRQELERILAALLGQLNDRQQRILRLHYGMEDGLCHSLEEIGVALGISKERVRQIEKQAMDKLRASGADMGLEDFLE